MQARRAVHLAAALILLAIASAACAPGGSPAPTILPGPSGAGTLSPAELRLLLVDRLGARWYCDPDEYPVAHGTEQENAVRAWPEVEAENELMRAIAARLSIDVDRPVTDEQKLAIYHHWKVAVSIPLDVIDTAHFRFDYTAQPPAGAQQGVRTTGTIDDHGNLTIEQQGPADAPNCPICLSIGTLIDTPRGPIAVESLRLGDPIWTLDAAGRRIEGVVIALGSTPAPAGHHVVRLILDDGRTVTASPGHPLADGREIGGLGIGDVVAGSRVVAAELVPYAGAATFDLVASGPTGLYLAGGIPLDSTLR